MSRWSGRLITKTPVTPGGASPTASAPGVWTLPEMAYWKKQGLWPDASADAYWGYVSYLMATSSLSNASNNLFVDSSGAFNPVTRSGNTTQGAVTPYGTLWSNYFPGAAGSYLSAPNNAAFQFGTGDLTIEAWIFISGDTITNPDGNRSATICSGIGASGVSNDFWFNVTGNTTTTGTGLDFQVFNGGSGTVIFNTAYSFSKSVWYHVAFTRSGNNVYLFVNGTLIASSTYSGTITVGSNPLLVGYGQTGSVNYRQPFFGYISNLRIVKGTALYTSAFTPATAPLTAVSGTSILTCQSNRFRDASSNAFTITVNGDTKVTPYSPFVLNAPGAVYNQSDISYWSGYFDGSGDYLRSNLNAVNIRTAFTIEGWVNLSTTTNFIFFTGSQTAGAAGQELYLGESGGTIYFGDGVSNNITFSASTIPVGSWAHIACTFDGTTYRVFVNGTSAGSSTTLLQNYTLNGVDIGGRTVGATAYLTGYVSNFRVVKGSALYTSNFTPPTASLTAISGTSLLTLQNAAFTDNSTNNYATTAFGNTTVTGNNPYQIGYYGNYFDGNGDGLSISNYSSSALAFGTSDFTIEFWAFATTTPNNNWTPFFTMGTSGGGQEIRVSQNVNGGGFGWLYPNNTNNGDVYSGYGAMTTNRWNHIAMTRSGSTMRLFLNGAVVATGTGVSFNFTNTTLLRIGLPQPAYADGAFTGYLSNLRIVKGTAVYTAAFTPPTAPLTAISGTGLLTCQANRLIDSSSNAFALTKVGDTSVVPFDPFYTATPASNGGSMYFDGNGDYLSLASNPGFSIGTSTTPFTIEGWLYPTAAGGVIFNEAYTGSGNTIPIAITMATNANSMDPTGGRYIAFGAYNGSFWTTAAYSSSQIQLNTWTHVACVFTGSTTKIFFNGVDVTAGTPATTWPVTGVAGDGWYVGRRWDTYADVYFSGYISDFRFTNGTAVYTTAFTPPTAPLTPSGNTVLLLNGMNAGTYDAAMQSNAETGGNAQVSSAQVKYGPTAMYFDGNGDYLLTAPSPVFTLGTGDFTAEAWVYLNAATSTYIKTIVGTYAYVGGGDRGWTLGILSTGQLTFFMGGSSGTGYQLSGSTTLATGQWYHLAATRSGSTVRLFINGTQEASGTSAYNEDYTGRGLKVATAEADSLSPSLGNPGTSINGYIDDVRITRGYARYTANFTPPTAALPVY